MCNERTVADIEYVKLLREERNWHIDSILKTNAQISLGAVALLFAGLLGSSGLRGLAQHWGLWFKLGAVLLLAGVVLFTIALAMHWTFRMRCANRCVRRMNELLSETVIATERGSKPLISAIPEPQWLFGWSLTIGLITLLFGGVCFLITVMRAPLCGAG